MATLNGKKVSESYKDLLQVSNSNSGVDATLRTVEDGEGTSAGVQLSTTDTSFNGNYILKEKGRQNHVANTFASPYYFMDSATTDNIVTASTSILPSGGADRSVSAWIYPSSTLTNTYNTIVKWGTQSGTYPQYAIVVHSSDSNKIRLLGYGNDVTQTGSEIVQLGKWNHVVLTYSGTTNNLYVNGVHDSSFAFPNGALQTTASSALYIGSFNGADYNFQGSIGSVQVWNRVLDASEVKELYSGKSVSYEYKGADNTHRITGNAFAQVGAVSGASATAFEFSSTGDGRAGWALTSNLEVGKTYKASFTATSATVDGEATAGNWQLRLYDSSGLNNTGSTNIVQFSHGAGATEATFINTGSSFSHIGFKSLTSSTNLKISDFDIREIGCVAEYDGTGVSSTYWYDKSGNDLHATVTGAEIANVPAGDENIVYEEGTFTPTWTGGYTGTITYNTAHTRGRYVRVGDQMTVWIDISVSSATSNSDQLTFELPANARAVHNNYIGTIYFQSNTGTLGGTYNIIRCTAPSADATIYVHQQTTSGNANVTGAMLGNGTVNIYMSYLLA